MRYDAENQGDQDHSKMLESVFLLEEVDQRLE